MPKKSKWGDQKLRPGNKEDMKLLKQKIIQLGEEAFDMKPEEIHHLHPSWQKYDAVSFCRAVNKDKASLSKFTMTLLVGLYYYTICTNIISVLLCTA